MSRCSRLPVIGEAAYLFYAPWVRAVCGVGWTGARRTRLVEHGQQCRRSALCKSREHAPVSAGGGLWARFRGPEVELLYRRENGAAGRRGGEGGGPKTETAAPSSGLAGFAVSQRRFPLCRRLAISRYGRVPSIWEGGELSTPARRYRRGDHTSAGLSRSRWCFRFLGD